MNKIFFSADLHFGHTNVLKHCPDRPYASDGDIEAHDGWLLNLWKSNSGCQVFTPEGCDSERKPASYHVSLPDGYMEPQAIWQHYASANYRSAEK